MTLCPVALAVGCKRCPIFSICPVKGQIGDYTQPVKPDTRKSGPEKPAAKKPASKKAASKKSK